MTQDAAVQVYTRFLERLRKRFLDGEIRIHEYIKYRHLMLRELGL